MAGSSESVSLATDPAVCATPEVESARTDRGGREGTVVVAGGYGAVGRTVCVLLAERFPGHATGVVAALVAGRLQASPLQRSVFHAEQLFDPLEVRSRA